MSTRAVFRPIPYIEWFVEREGEPAHDIASSDLRPPSSAADKAGRTAAVGHDDVVPPRLAGLPSPDPDPDAPTAEALLAERYDVAPGNVALAAGATHANALIAGTVLDHPDDVAADDRSRVLVETPGYQPHHVTPASLSADVWRFRRDDGELDPDRVEGAIDDTVDLATLTNRHNPTGRLAARKTLAEVARVCADHDAVLLADEVYAPYTAEDDGVRTGEPFGGVTAAGLPNTVVTNSLTKFFGFGGLRFGWVIGPTGVVDDVRTTARHIPDLADPSRVLGRRALANADALAAESRDLVEPNHALLERFVADRDDLHGTVHAGCSFALLEYDASDAADGDGENDALGRDGSDRPDHGDRIADAAWEDGVFVVPGRFFGAADSIRVSLGGHPDEMESALAALGTVLDGL